MRFLRFVDELPLLPLIAAAVLLGLAPFRPEPHLVEKARMLFQGTLSRPIDIFDLFMHGTPALLLIVRLVRIASRRDGSPSET